MNVEYGSVSALKSHVLYFVKSIVVFQSVFTLSELQAPSDRERGGDAGHVGERAPGIADTVMRMSALLVLMDHGSPR